MTDLMTHAKEFVEHRVAEMSGDEDFMPFMLLNTNIGCIYAGLLMPGEDDEKDKLADSMMALVAVHRPSEVVFVTTAWMVKPKDGKPLDMSTPISQQDNRMEAVFVAHHKDATDVGDFADATLTRRVDGAVVLSQWKERSGMGLAGRFARAIQQGMYIAENLPPSMHAYLDEEIAEGRASEAGDRVIRAQATARQQMAADAKKKKEAFKN